MSTVFYPSCVVNFTLKFDESLHIQPETTPQTNDDRLNLSVVQASRSPLKPLVTQRGAENVSYVAERIPKSLSVDLPGYRQAGQFKASFDFRDFPLDPRTIRAAAVEIHLGTVSPDNFAVGMDTALADGRRTSALRTNIDGIANPETLLMVGLIDGIQTDFGDGDATVSIEGRDLRGLLLDTPLTTDPRGARGILGTLDTSRPIHEVVKDLLRFNPHFQQINVFAQGSDWPDGTIPAPGAASVLMRHRKGAKGNMRGGRPSQGASSNNISFWDVIVKMCFLVGAIPYFVGNEIRIRPARALYAQQRAGADGLAPPTPFAGGSRREVDEAADPNARIDPPIALRRLVYGRDVQRIQFDRKLGGYQRPRGVRVIAVDTAKNERLVQAVWPPRVAQAARRTREQPSGGTSSTEIVNFPAPAGIRDQDRLRQIAQAIYEEIGRGEVGGSVETKNLASFGGINADPDLVRLKPGDGVELVSDLRNLQTQTPLVSTVTDQQRDSLNEAAAKLDERLGDENLARVIVSTSRGQVAELQRFFRVSNVHYDWDVDTGVGLSFDFQNYVEAVFDVAPDGVDESAEPAGQQIATVPNTDQESAA